MGYDVFCCLQNDERLLFDFDDELKLVVNDNHSSDVTISSATVREFLPFSATVPLSGSPSGVVQLVDSACDIL